jgi:hypothetical protein
MAPAISLLDLSLAAPIRKLDNKTATQRHRAEIQLLNSNFLTAHKGRVQSSPTGTALDLTRRLCLPNRYVGFIENVLKTVE